MTQANLMDGSVLTNLLGFVEAVDLIDEQDGLPLTQTELILGLLDYFSNLAGGRAGGGEHDEASCTLLFTGAGNDVSKSSLAGTKNKPKI